MTLVVAELVSQLPQNVASAQMSPPELHQALNLVFPIQKIVVKVASMLAFVLMNQKLDQPLITPRLLPYSNLIGTQSFYLIKNLIKVSDILILF